MSESIWNDPRITAYVLDELSSEERAAFDDELKSDSELEAAVDEARLVTGKLRGLYAAESTPPLDADRREQILSAESAPVVPMTGDTSSREKLRRSWRLPVAAFAAAATLLLLVGLAPWLRDQLAVPTLSQLPKQEVATAKVAEAVETADIEEDGEIDWAPSSEVNANGSLAKKHPVAFDDGFELRDKDRDVSIVMDQLKSVDDSRDALALNVSESGASQRPAEPNQALGRPLGESNGRKHAPAAGADRGAVSRSLNEGRDAAKRGDNAPSGQRLTEDDVRGRMSRQQQVQNEKSLQQRIVNSELGSASGKTERLSEVRESLIEFKAEVSEVRRNRKMREETEKIPDDRFSSPATANTSVPIAGSPIGNPAPANGFALEAAKASPNSELKRITDSHESVEGLARQSGGFALPTDTFDIRANDNGLLIDDGRGPGIAGDRFEPITDNPFQRVSEHPMSTFSVDVDTASYSKVRDFLMRANQLPRPDAVRIEEMVNYFDYDYQPPAADDVHPFAARVSVTSCPWNEEHRLARIALKGKTMDKGQRPRCNLVFLLDTSGSMNAPNKLPLVLQGMKMLLSQLNDNDNVAIVVYAGSAGLVLDSTSAGEKKQIRQALNRLSAGGSTNGGAGIALAYQTARSNFIKEGVNRVILCTDGDFNVGTTGTDSLVRMVEEEAKGGVFLSVLGFGMGNHNDAMLEQISGRGNGNYAFIDTEKEAHKVLVDQTSGTLVTIAKDVKLQIVFNPAEVSSYRLIGYENRILAKEDFNDDKKDAGEIGAGHAVTAFYELVPSGVKADAIGPKVDGLIYQTDRELTAAADSGELMTLKLRYKQPEGDTSTLVEIPVTDEGGEFEAADDDVRFAAAVAGFGMQLRRSQYAGSWTLSDALKVARASRGEDRYELRAEFIEMVRRASEIMGEE